MTSCRIFEKHGIHGLEALQSSKSTDIIHSSVVAWVRSIDWLALGGIFVGAGPFLLADFHRQEPTLTGRFAKACLLQLVVANRLNRLKFSFGDSLFPLLQNKLFF